MMKGPERFSVAVRKASGEIRVKDFPISAGPTRKALSKMPLLRGVVTMAAMLVIGYRALAVAGIGPSSAGARLGLYGFGASAHIAIQIARHWGCDVYVSSLKAEHQTLARELGAVWVGGAHDAPPDPLHGSIIFAPAGELVPPALRALERGGTLALAGIHMSAIPSIDYDRELFGERILRSVTANTRQDGIDLLRFLVDESCSAKVLIMSGFPAGVQEAAKRLGISPRTLRYKLAQLREMGLGLATAA